MDNGISVIEKLLMSKYFFKRNYYEAKRGQGSEKFLKKGNLNLGSKSRFKPLIVVLVFEKCLTLEFSHWDLYFRAIGS